MFVSNPWNTTHVDGLVTAAGADPSLYQWSPVPQGKREATQYIDTAVAWREAGSAVPFAIVRVGDGAVIGSTRFWNLERWSWRANAIAAATSFIFLEVSRAIRAPMSLSGTACRLSKFAAQVFGNPSAWRGRPMKRLLHMLAKHTRH